MQLSTFQSSPTIIKLSVMEHSFERLSAIAVIIFLALLGLAGLIYWIATDLLHPYSK